MYLKRLELHGFKSFPEKTVLNFNAGATIIVGPNGSGKSNITDAMRWVLGERSTKNIRGSEMEDVIFVGADGHRPMGFAEVSVTFDDTEEPRRLNSPYDEVTVTRRYYRAGESEYFINRKPCRLKDIYDLFLNTGIGREGYAIIGQGRIAEIISKKSDDRRGIFEETAGIARYRERKVESQKRLAETDANMVRLTDIFSELENRIGPLERDAKKARRYLELYGEKKELDVSIWLYDMEKLQEDIEKTRADCMMSAHELEMADDTKNQFEAQSDRLFEASQENKTVTQKLYEEIREKTELLHELENSFRVLESDRQHTESLIGSCRLDIEKIEVLLEEEKLHTKELEEKLAAARALFSEKETRLFELAALRDEKLSAKKAIEERIDLELSALRERERELSDLTVRLEVLKKNLSDQSQRGETIEEDIKRHREELSAMEKSAEDAEETCRLYDKSIEEINASVASLEKEREASEKEAGELRDDISSLVSQIGALDSRIGALKRMAENFDGYNNSVKYVMTESSAGRLSGIRGPVSHLISVEDKYIIAVETALGANLQSIIVDDEAAAKGAMYSLKRSGAGRATFYPISTVKGRSMTGEVSAAAGYTGFVGYADELVKYSSEYSEIMKYLMGNIPVFDNIDNASAMAKSQRWRVRAVTLDGQQVNAGGSFTGGSVRRDSGVLSRTSHITKLSADRDALTGEKEEVSSELKKIEVKISDIATRISGEKERLSITDTLMRSEKAVFDELSAKIEVKRALVDELVSDAESITEMRRLGKADVEEIEKQRGELEAVIEKISSSRTEGSISVGELEYEADEIFGEMNELRVAMAESRRDAENTEELIRDSVSKCEGYVSDTESKKSDIAALEEKLVLADAEIASKKGEAEKLRDELSVSEAKRRELEDGGMDFERRLNEVRHKLSEISSKKELLFITHTKNEAKLEQLSQELEKNSARIWDEYELTHVSALAQGYSETTRESRPERAKRLSELKASIKALGHTNPDAIEEYAEQKARFDELGRQLDDLTKSKNELEKIIADIDTEMAAMFCDTFEKVNKNFGEVFKELFGGGNAYLTLTDPENVLTSGIEISAAPPGKMIKKLSLLSGGEQAFVAIALLFALIKVNPSPFCIFDEIEAALDEVNVTRVANYVKRYSKELQMIVISHRRGMMEVADTLYGVTMPKRGVSKVFVLDVDGVSEKTADVSSFVE